ncbi:MAG TPA: PadR family transcriptional regulator [Candidatus Sulfotelmatobacter sp.]|nr:PadR family transcriptional regulator [Candidatus Sulfotelmatobacter sp.]
MSKTQERASLLQGTLDMLILRTLLYGPAHGHHIGKHIQRTTNDFLQMQHGSLYPALHRLERKGWVVSKWEAADDRNREFKYYRLTAKGKKQLGLEQSRWKQMVDAVARVLSGARRLSRRGSSRRLTRIRQSHSHQRANSRSLGPGTGWRSFSATLGSVSALCFARPGFHFLPSL